ncbi:MAG TPA: carbohydrate kinase [Terriglobales bacterium]|nr:carbohydrate kinase [Terriglobales bacterium]
MRPAHTVVGLGEILWDMLPSGRQIGGAPANFAYCSHLLGEKAVVASRVGEDLLGQEIRDRLTKAGISDHFLQADDLHPTGTVQVQLDDAGQPKFEITRDVAWDFLEWTDEWQRLAREADAVCFGSLAQRSAHSRNTIRKFLDSTLPNTLRIFDVNLRQTFYSAEIVSESLQRANVVKLNHEEVPKVRDLLALSDATDLSLCKSLIKRFDLKVVCVTRGAQGSLLCDRITAHEQPGFPVKVKDTVGAGDAFTAALVDGLLQEHSLAHINESANRLGAWVASQPGGMPKPPVDGIAKLLIV